MSDGDSSIPQLLLAYELGLLDEGESKLIAARIAAEPELARQAAALRRTLQPLAAWTAPEPSADLVDRICGLVEFTSPLKYVAAKSALPPAQETASGRGRWFSLRELASLAACLVILFGVFNTGVSSNRSRRLQTLCGNNLASLYSGLGQYASENGGLLPQTTPVQNASWLQVPNRQYAPNIHHVAPAIRIRFIVPRNTVCPAAKGAKQVGAAGTEQWPHLVIQAGSGWYSMQNLNGPVPAFAARVDLPFAADANPLFEGGQPRLTGSPDANSRTHAGRGQNVLFIDGAVRFVPSPLVGQGKDNIWQAGDRLQYDGTETQESVTDAFLIP
jgi:hypothetical protein